MKVIIRESAENDLDRIFEWISKHNRGAAADLVLRIRERINQLELDPLARMGRPGFVADTRELVEYPYIVVYQVLEERREIVWFPLSMVHRIAKAAQSSATSLQCRHWLIGS
jgi:plasmid stabilization system protein ParE